MIVKVLAILWFVLAGTVAMVRLSNDRADAGLWAIACALFLAIVAHFV